MVRGGSDQRNITVWEPGQVGGEYIKTYGHYHVGDLDETYWVLYGEGIAVVQKRVEGAGGPIDDEIEGIYVVRVKAGDSLYMPYGWGHLVVNTGSTFLATADDSPVNFEEVDPVSLPGHADYEAVKRMRGFAYYVVERDGKATLVKNPMYKKVPEATIIEAREYSLRKGS
jgi:glucose-6-phosphate isomerase